MTDYIEANNIVGLKVYGQQQVDYTVDGAIGKDFGTAVARASMLRAVAVEGLTSALTDVVRLRERKLTDLGKALAYISAAAADFNKDSKTGDTTSSVGLATARSILKNYGIEYKSIVLSDSTGVIKNENVGKLQTNVQYEMDKEDNYLQQDLVSVQGYFSKRDQALSMAASLVKKVNNTMSSGIRAVN